MPFADEQNNFINVNSDNSTKRFFVSENINEKALYPPNIDFSTFVISTEKGLISHDYLQNDSFSFLPFEDNNSFFSILETNLTSLKYDMQATAENNPTNTFWSRESEGISSANRLDGQISIDTADFIEGSASSKFTVTTNNSLNFYSDFRLLDWENNSIPSLFNYNSLISGAFRFDATSNLLGNSFGFRNMLRFRFNNSNNAINILFNQSSGYESVNSSIIYLTTNENFIININLNSEETNPSITTWSENNWIRFVINITEILNILYPIGGDFRSDAETIFSNLSTVALEIQSMAMENGLIDLWLDDLHWVSTLPESIQNEWDKNNPVFVNQNTSLLQNSSIFDPKIFQWDSKNVGWKIGLKLDRFSIVPLSQFLPYIPTWSYLKQTFYHYNQTWSFFSSPVNEFQLNISYSFFSANYYPNKPNTTHITINNPNLLINKVFNKDLSMDLINIEDFQFSIGLLRNFPFQYSHSYSETSTEQIWSHSTLETQNKYNNLVTILENDPDFEKFALANYHHDYWKTDGLTDILHYIQYNPTPQAFIDLIFQFFPVIDERIEFQNLLLELQEPNLEVFESGLQLSVHLNPNKYLNYYTFQSETLTQHWSSKTNHILSNNEENTIFIPWLERPHYNEHVVVKLLLLSNSTGIGWVELHSTYLINLDTTLSTSILLNTSTTNFSTNSYTTNQSEISLGGNDNIFGTDSNFQTDSASVVIYSLLVLGPLVGSFFYYKRRQRNKFYDLIFDE
jgi:hypothetical protein